MGIFYGTADELLATLEGRDLEEYRAEKAEQAALRAEAEVYRSLNPDQWPTLSFNWSLDRTYWHKSFDGWHSRDVAEHYPEGLLVGWTDLQTFDASLCLYNRRRDLEELWSCGSESKLAYMLAYLSHGNPISPIVVGFATDGQICLHGGNHRYTAAKFSGEQRFPFLCSTNDKEKLEQRLSIDWLA